MLEQSAATPSEASASSSHRVVLAWPSPKEDVERNKSRWINFRDVAKRFRSREVSAEDRRGMGRNLRMRNGPDAADEVCCAVETTDRRKKGNGFHSSPLQVSFSIRRSSQPSPVWPSSTAGSRKYNFSRKSS